MRNAYMCKGAAPAGCQCVGTFGLSHHHREKPDGSIDVAEPAAVELEDDGGLGNQS